MNIKPYIIEKQIESVGIQVNEALRDFYHNEKDEGVFLYFTKTELPRLSGEELEKTYNDIQRCYRKLHLNMLVGRLAAKQTIDCGEGITLLTGSFVEQKIDTVFITREAVKQIGYFDERITDSCAYGDYAHRLSDASLYPKLTKKYLPWLFDISEKITTPSKCILNELSCGWFNYKHGDFPQNKNYETLDELKLSLKAYIKSKQ